MADNMLAGSGPSSSMGGNADGPSPGLSGTLGATPQASPTPEAGNMFNQPAAPGGPANGMAPQGPAGQQPVEPPPVEKVIEALHKTSYVNAALRQLLSMPDLKTKDILNEVGEAVASGIMGPFDAAQELKSLPPGDDSLSLRKWVAQHYSASSQHMQTLAEMVHAHGQMVRGGMGQPPAPQINNAFQAA